MSVDDGRSAAIEWPIQWEHPNAYVLELTRLTCGTPLAECVGGRLAIDGLRRWTIGRVRQLDSATHFGVAAVRARLPQVALGRNLGLEAENLSGFSPAALGAGFRLCKYAAPVALGSVGARTFVVRPPSKISAGRLPLTGWGRGTGPRDDWANPSRARRSGCLE